MGAELVARFLANGDAVIGTDCKEETLAALTNRYGSEKRLTVIAANITEEADCQRLADTARDKLGRVDVLINCAGYFPITPFEQMSAKEWRQIIDVNLTGPFFSHARFAYSDERARMGSGYQFWIGISI
jgi:3-oxoacyl-[acyl-carrier protein] reductase